MNLADMIDPRPVRWIWMDLDDTLIDFRKNSRIALTKLYDGEGLAAWYPDAESWIEAYEKVNKPLWKEYSSGIITMAKLRLDRFLVPLLSGGMDEDEALNRAVRYDTYYLDLLAMEKSTVPYAHEVLRDLRSKGYRLGVLSNGFAEVQYRKLSSSGLSGLVDLVVLSDDIGVPKPDPRLYIYAMDKSGCPEPSAHLMVGDNPDTDIRGALGVGWQGIYFDREGKAISAQAATITSLVQLTGLL